MGSPQQTIRQVMTSFATATRRNALPSGFYSHVYPCVRSVLVNIDPGTTVTRTEQFNIDQAINTTGIVGAGKAAGMAEIVSQSDRCTAGIFCANGLQTSQRSGWLWGVTLELLRNPTKNTNRENITGSVLAGWGLLIKPDNGATPFVYPLSRLYAQPPTFQVLKASTEAQANSVATYDLSTDAGPPETTTGTVTTTNGSKIGTETDQWGGPGSNAATRGPQLEFAGGLTWFGAKPILALVPLVDITGEDVSTPLAGVLHFWGQFWDEIADDNVTTAIGNGCYAAGHCDEQQAADVVTVTPTSAARVQRTVTKMPGR